MRVSSDETVVAVMDWRRGRRRRRTHNRGASLIELMEGLTEGLDEVFEVLEAVRARSRHAEHCAELTRPCTFWRAPAQQRARASKERANESAADARARGEVPARHSRAAHTFMWCGCEKALPQPSQVYGFSPVCVR